MKYMKNLVWRAFQCMEIVEVENWKKKFCLMFVYKLIISNTKVCHQQSV